MRLNLKSLIGNIIFIAAIILIFSRFLTIWTGVPFPMNVVASKSMQPSLYKGDIVPWIPCDIDSAEAGDVVVFKSYQTMNNEEKLIAHRVVEIKKINGQTQLITKGDTNEYTDQAGPHIPEPPIGKSHFMGKTISIGKQPMKIPFIGYLWLWMQDAFKELSASIAWGKPQSSTHYGVFIPIGIAVAALVAGLVIWAPKNKKTDREILDENIFGPERITFKRVLAYSAIFYIGFLMITYCFAYDDVSASVGVDEKSTKSVMNFGQLRENETSFPKRLPIVNPSLLPNKVATIAKGEIAPFLDFNGTHLFKLETGKRTTTNITATIPKGTKPGIYEGKIFIYSSPYWIILPNQFMESLYDWNPAASIIIFDLASALILAIATTLLLLLLSWAIEEYTLQRAHISWSIMKMHPKFYPLYNFWHRLDKGKEKIRIKGKNAFAWLNSGMDWIDFDPKKPVIASLVAIAFLPLLLLDSIGNFIIIILMTAFITGLIAYLLGCRWRGEIMLTAILSTAWITTLFAIISFTHIFTTNHSLLMPMAFTSVILGVILVLFVILIVPICFLSWLPGYLIQNYREKRNPLIMLKECDL